MRVALLFVALFSFLTPLYVSPLMAEENNQREEQKIEYLLNRVKNAKGQFLRNGKSYDSERAYQHLKHKLSRAKKMFWFFGPETSFTAKQFIEKIASRSSTTGNPYYIKLPSGEKIKTEVWLKNQLQKYEEGEKGEGS